MLIAEIVEPSVRRVRKPLAPPKPKPKPLPKMPVHPDARRSSKRPRPFNEPKRKDQS